MTFYHSLAAFLATITASTVCGQLIGKYLRLGAPTSIGADSWVIGVTLAPFLVSVITIFFLVMRPGMSPEQQLAAVLLTLTSVCSILLIRIGKKEERQFQATDYKSFFFTLLTLAWVGLLISNAIRYPLTSNDSLEYFIVAKELAKTGDILSYPFINPATTDSGFFAPWTHPPIYPVLIQLFSALDNNIYGLRFSRLIASWFLLAASYGIFAICRNFDRPTAWLASIFFISTPLLFLNVDQSQIDSLSIAGLAVLTYCLCYLDLKKRSHLIFTGVMLGITLWTHSQAVLFPVYTLFIIVIVNGLKRPKSIIFTSFFILAPATVVAFPAYYRNFLIFGSIVSDNPRIFAIPELRWSDFFEYARFLNTKEAWLQYGMLKGWFSISSFGLLFWILLLRVWQTRHLFKPKIFFHLVANGCSDYSIRDRVQLTCATIIIVFLSGVLVSSIIGIDLMIKNDRYWLPLILPVTILSSMAMIEFASSLLSMLRSKSLPSIKTEAILAAIFFAVLLLLVNVFLVGFWYRSKTLPSANIASYEGAKPVIESFSSFQNRALRYWPGISLALDHKLYISKDGAVLSMRPADMFYSKARMVSYLDPRLEDVYLDKDPASARAKLVALGVSHVQLTDYTLPVYQYTPIMSILSDPAQSSLVASAGGHQLYKLEGSKKVVAELIEFGPSQRPWIRETKIKFAGAKVMKALPIFEPAFLLNSSSEASFPWFQKEYSTILTHGVGSFGSIAPRDSFIQIMPNSEYRLDFQISGNGYVRFFVHEYNDKLQPILQENIEGNAPILIGELYLTGDHPKQNFSRRLAASSETKFLRIAIEHLGKSRVSIVSASVSHLQ